MRRAVILTILAVLALAVLTPLASASFTLRNHSIEKDYAPGENIEGSITISFKNELNTKIKAGDDFSGEKKLKDFLDDNNAGYNCTPEGCEDDYSITNGTGRKNFSLGYGEEKVLGLKLSGIVDRITGLSFNVSADNELSCKNPLEVDILDDNVVEWKAEKLTDVFECTYKDRFGCFNEPSEKVRIGQNTYCEKISLIKNKKFKIGAWIRGNESTKWYAGLLEMVLYDLYGTQLAYCDLEKPNLNGEEIDCVVELDEEIEGQHYICLKSEEDTYYRIKRENKEPCGFYGSVPNDYNYDYYIFARAPRFGKIGTFSFNQEEYEKTGSENLAEYIDAYIDYKYDKQCSDGCVIPIKFKTKTSIDIGISNILLGYQKEGSPVEEEEIYDVGVKPAKISSDFLVLDLAYLNISAPEEHGTYDLMLYLNEKKILGKEIKIRVENVPVIKTISPQTVPAAIPVTFSVEVDRAGRNISSYRWDFGDNKTEETIISSVSHTYSSIGSYSLKIEIEDSEGYITSKEFIITAGSPEKVANSTIKKYKERLSNLTSQLTLIPGWHNVSGIINLDELKKELVTLEREYYSVSNDDDYVRIMADLIEMKVPYSIKEIGKGEIPFFISVDDINLGRLEEFGAGNYSESKVGAYKEAIAAWAEENLVLSLEFKYVSAYYDSGMKNILSVFNLKIDALEEKDGKLYVIIEEDVMFKEEAGTKKFIDARGVKFSDIKDRNIEFSVLGDVPLGELKIYLSPEFSQLIIEKITPCNFNGKCESEYDEDWKNCRADCKPWGWVAIALVIILFSALVAYIILQWWYKRRYESYLFKKRNDFYNIFNFIRNAKKQDWSEEEIVLKLKKAGWSGEQIRYAFKKIKGKTIMPFDFLGLFKKFKKSEAASGRYVHLSR